MFQSLLIANRGEIAYRVLRTCQEMGIRTIAVYSDADQDTLVVKHADLALRLGPPTAAESYLLGDKLLALAAEHGAEAIHPGYGFLSENTVFAQACTDKGIVFIGPPPEAVKAMGDKAEAKRLMQSAGVPVIPGYEGESQDDETLRTQADQVGYPLLIKAVAGGGGRGIRLVEEPASFLAALASARREAASGFGDDRLMLEKFLTSPRHVEFQILADSQGNTLHLFERECSIQRRHQKIIEETPSPVLTPELREAMGAAAIKAASAIGYLGAGTVEFLVDGNGEFYFLEMNTRLQVEHPITEMTLGLDLVRLQIEIAAGEAIPFQQSDLSPKGHAIECRLNAEDPSQGFLPDSGRLAAFDFPAGEGLRTDTGFQSGGVISTYYDAMLGKMIAWGANREEALARMEGMLGTTMVAGISSNLPFLQAVLPHSSFRAGQYTTQFVEQNEDELLNPTLSPAVVQEIMLAASAVEAIGEREKYRAMEATDSSPWTRPTPWQASAIPNATLRRVLQYGTQQADVEIEILSTEGNEATVLVTQGEEQLDAVLYPDTLSLENAGHNGERSGNTNGTGTLVIQGRRIPLRWVNVAGDYWLVIEGLHRRVRADNPFHEPGHDESAEAARALLQAPLPGKVIQLGVTQGQQVEPGDLLMIVEAMKMEHRVTAPFAGQVTAIYFKEGDPVNKAELLLDLEPSAE